MSLIYEYHPPPAAPSKNDSARAARPVSPPPNTAGAIHVALFCGGRGSATIIRELIRRPQIRLSLLINGYDDGLSTGELRGLVPSMLGPSDFRKNLARLLDLHSTQQYALQRLLEFRFPDGFSATEQRVFESFVTDPAHSKWLPSPLDVLFADLQPGLRRVVIGQLRSFFAHIRESGQRLNYRDCSLGNLVFAGAYLESDSDFNTSLRNLSENFGTTARLINITRGENRSLVALKSDGSILWREAEIVGPQSDSAIAGIYLLEHAPEAAVRERIERVGFGEKRRALEKLDSPVRISPEADYALRRADIIVFGPGTQFSSLLPSYRTEGLREALRESTASVRALVANLDVDHDIQSLTAADLTGTALAMMGDPEGREGLITHVFCNAAGDGRTRGFRTGALAERFPGIRVITSNFESPAKPGTHSGHAVVEHALALHEGHERDALASLEVYVDLRDRSRAIESLVQEISDLPIPEHFRRVQLRVNRSPRTDVPVPSFLNLMFSEYKGAFTEVDALLNWLAHGDTDYLVTLTGDGEYRLADILVGVQILQASGFGALYGSRTQSRRQLSYALDSAYGEHPWLRFLSWCGAFLFAALHGLWFRVILSDPFTGFRIYRRGKLGGPFTEQLMKRGPVPAAAITRLMLRNRIEIAEMPVTYRTFRGFTSPGWRIVRALRNAWGMMF